MYYRFLFSEGLVFDVKYVVNFFEVVVWFGAFAHFNDSIKGILARCGNHFLCIGYSGNFSPIVFDGFCFELVSDGIDQPVGKYAEVQMSHAAVVVFVVNGAQIQLCFQTAEGTFYFPDGVVYVPYNNLVGKGEVGAQKIKAKAVYFLLVQCFIFLPDEVGGLGCIVVGA